MPAATLRRAIPAAPERVWRLWTTREGLESWYFPSYLRPAVRELDLRAGGRWRIVAPGLPFEAKGTFLDVRAPSYLHVRVEFTFDGGLRDHDREERLTLRSTPGGCELTLTSSTLPDDATRKAVEGAWTLALNRLEAALGDDASRGAGPALDEQGGRAA
jgi:uncharacterized protein YndB with AHSA1/START domain